MTFRIETDTWRYSVALPDLPSAVECAFALAPQLASEGHGHEHLRVVGPNGIAPIGFPVDQAARFHPAIYLLTMPRFETALADARAAAPTVLPEAFDSLRKCLAHEAPLSIEEMRRAGVHASMLVAMARDRQKRAFEQRCLSAMIDACISARVPFDAVAIARRFRFVFPIVYAVRRITHRVSCWFRP